MYVKINFCQYAILKQLACMYKTSGVIGGSSSRLEPKEDSSLNC